MSPLLTSPVLLLALALALRLLPLRVDRDEPWSTRVDLPLALVLGLATAAVKAWWLAQFLMNDGTDTSDMGDICATVEALRNLDISAVKRQPVAALLPAALSHPLGFFDGLCASSLLSATALGAALYLWARVLHSRAAGVAAAVFSCALTPLVVMTRYLTFYPECIAAYALCAAGVAAAMRWRTRATLGLAGAGVGLALAVDHMGLVFALAPLAVALVAALRPPSREQQTSSLRRRLMIRVGVLVAPVLLSWVGTRLVTPDTMYTFEDKAIMFTEDNVGRDIMRVAGDHLGGGEDDPYEVYRQWLYPMVLRSPPGTVRHGYNWGRAGPVGMARALLTLALLSQEKPHSELPPHKVGRATLDTSRASQITPWLPVAGVALLLTCLAMWRRRWELVGLLAVLAPFAVILKAVSETQVFPKYLMAPMMPIPVLLGVAWVTVANRPAGQKRPGRLHRAAAPALYGVIIGLLVTGLVPSWLAPDGPWRMKHATDDGFYGLYNHKSPPFDPGGADPAACKRLARQDHQDGAAPAGRLYPRARFLDSQGQRRQQRSIGDPPIKGRPPPPPPERQGTKEE